MAQITKYFFSMEAPHSPWPFAMIVRHKTIRSVLNVQLKILRDLVTRFSK